uniref:Uncharacterized protein n=1 Tax=Lepeophtheirus salmonis TaxID=72036 RepID=A0A0K2UD22_LEPSM
MCKMHISWISFKFKNMKRSLLLDRLVYSTKVFEKPGLTPVSPSNELYIYVLRYK